MPNCAFTEGIISASTQESDSEEEHYEEEHQEEQNCAAALWDGLNRHLSWQDKSYGAPAEMLTAGKVCKAQAHHELLKSWNSQVHLFMC